MAHTVNRPLLLGIVCQNEKVIRAFLVFEVSTRAHYMEMAMDSSNMLRQLLMFGIGTTSLVAERVKKMSEELVRDGKLDPDQAKGFVDDFMAQFNIDQGALEKQMQRQVRNIMQDLGVPRQAEMDELRGRLDRLERQVRELENKDWKS